MSLSEQRYSFRVTVTVLPTEVGEDGGVGPLSGLGSARVEGRWSSQTSTGRLRFYVDEPPLSTADLAGSVSSGGVKV